MVVRRAANFQVRRWFGGALLGLLVVWCGCDSKSKSAADSAPAGDLIVARVGDFTITATDLQAEWARRHPAVGIVLPGEAAPALLETLVREKTLLVQAQAAGWAQEPETRRLIEQLLVSRFLAAEIGRRETNAGPPTAAALQTIYEAQIHRWTEPAAWRGGVIWLRQSSKADPEARAALRDRASQLRHQGELADAAAFVALVQQHSDHQATRYRGGDTGWWSVGQPAGFEAAVMSVLTNLTIRGAVAPVVERPDGFYIVRLVEARASWQRPLAEVRAALEYEWLQQHRQQREAELFAELTRGVPVAVDQQALGRAFPPNPAAARVQPPRSPSGSF